MIGKIVISYSSADKQFAVKLAQRLRKEGFDLWIDQLDIRAGAHWDREVQAALTASAIVLVILSPTSVASDNVLDEVAFALDNRKSVVPVRMSECTLPLRLVRMQYVDFAGDFEEAFRRCLRELRQRLLQTSQIDARQMLTVGTQSAGHAAGEQEFGLIRVSRFSKWGARLRSYKIYLNGKQVGVIGNNSQIDLVVPTGDMTVTAGIDWCGSEALPLRIASGQTIDIEVADEHSALTAITAFIWPGKYLTLRPLRSGS